MKSTRIILTVTLLCFYFSSAVNCRRIRRRLDEFGEMILLTTDRNPMDYNGYGNWCGLGGSGKTIDVIDECCKVHDKCYLKLNHGDCDTLLRYRIYTTEYKWSFKSGQITCNEEDPCGAKLCHCDSTAAQCFGEHKDDYNAEHKHNVIKATIKNLFGKLA
ncbi:phospholipase A2 SSD387-like isoform X2 [Mercenaria mercenaria]|nr:phospholipase A2 SSD387-like isoform X2 [Mercenaria mercenaria]XP_045212520.1 phospholipase A2 SSD387-like isoform X2 [Mercenaria mercenaria]XP_045212521.1 phospholipase A2 SSD387-like isoform X2 [Mercenaria mercenaria]